MHASVYESTCTREAPLVWSLQTQSLLPSFVWKLIVSRTGSVTYVSSAHNTIPTTPNNRAFLINQSLSDLIRDLTRNLLKRKHPATKCLRLLLPPWSIPNLSNVKIYFQLAQWFDIQIILSKKTVFNTQTHFCAWQQLPTQTREKPFVMHKSFFTQTLSDN